MKITPKCSFCETLGFEPHCNKCHMTGTVKINRTAPITVTPEEMSFAEMLADICDINNPTKYIAGDRYVFKNKAGITWQLIYNGEGGDFDKDGDYVPCFTLLGSKIDAPMNLTSTHRGGYISSYMKKDIIPQILFLLPDEIAKYLTPVKKYTNCPQNDRDDDLLETFEVAYPYSEMEVYGETHYSLDGEGTQYEIFKKYNLRELGFQDGYYYLRSVDYDTSSAFCVVPSDGSYGSYHAGSSSGLALGLNFKYKS